MADRVSWQQSLPHRARRLREPDGEASARRHQSERRLRGVRERLFPGAESPDGLASLQGLVRAVRKALQAEVSAEVYLLPRGAKAFPPFAAGYDLLILQLEGETTWHFTSSLYCSSTLRRRRTSSFHWNGTDVARRRFLPKPASNLATFSSSPGGCRTGSFLHVGRACT